MTEESPPNIELTMIRAALEQAHRDVAVAARLLGITPAEFQRRMQKYGLSEE
jgi:transcriptional regulator with GAF, ATPase, and Fis domain